MSKVKTQLAQLLGQYAQIRLAIIFGSVASGNATESSDVDLAVLTGTKLSNDLRLELIKAIGIAIGRPVDIVDLFDAGEPILGQVFKGERVLGSDAEYGALLSRHLIDAADFLPLRQRILRERREAWID